MRQRQGLRARKKTRHNYKEILEDDSLIQSTKDDVTLVALSFDSTEMIVFLGSMKPLISMLLTQSGIKKRLRIFGDDGNASAEAKIRQLHRL